MYMRQDCTAALLYILAWSDESKQRWWLGGVGGVLIRIQNK